MVIWFRLMAFEKTTSTQNSTLAEQQILRDQLEKSLQFHHSHTLKQLPPEVAIQVMAEVWCACHPEYVHQCPDPRSTLVILD